MIINISTDRIIFIGDNQKHILAYGELEKNVSDFLYSDTFAAMVRRISGPIVVINGPGSFTNLRIMTLALNTYNTLHNFSLDFVNINKVAYYAMLYKHGLVKQYCVMYIGQRKNFWVIDLAVVTNYELRIANGAKDGLKKIHIDALRESVENVDSERFVDNMVAEGKDVVDAVIGNMGYEMYSLEDNYREGVIDYKDYPYSKLLEPEYMIDANVG